MMRHSVSKFRVSGLLVLLAMPLLVLSGCISTVPTPSYARAGDVVNIGLGGIKRNASGQRIFSEDLTVTITDASSAVYTPEILGTYRVYPDHASMYAVGAQDRTNGNFGDLYPHDGATWVAIRLRYPSGGPGSGPLPLAPGDGFISVSSAKIQQTNKAEEGLYSQFDITILEGTRGPSQNDNQYLAYQTEGYLSVIPSSIPTVPVAGAQFEIIYDELLTAGDDIELRLMPQHHDPNLGLIQSVSSNGDGTKTLRAYLTNPNGFVDVNNWSQGQSTYFDLDLALTSQGGSVVVISPAQISSSFTVTANSYYIDMNGDPVSGVVPLIQNEFY